ncbi:DEAD/DEAH box helicase [Blattabacterium cuenoti]|uniref:DEAD/DEAH box helicase n=1 Tax=Blattabacterium cuenoti TaxID=1653831 RepID=UPI00163CA091|nr:DEAD/DEAH box helicase [Blattabacterium cuenoti]
MKTFKENNYLNNKIIQALEDIGLKRPTPIQKKIIPYLLKKNELEKKDLIALSQTGTGKTAAFGLPIIQKINLNFRDPQVLILCPTRELCIQITRDLCRFSKYISLIKIIPLYGGVNIENQIKSLQKKTHIIVGTPGRIIDLIKRKKLHLSDIKYLILDEADEMLNMGFKEELDFIIEKLPKKRQSLLFSATMSKYMSKIAYTYLIDPIEIIAGKKNVGSDDVHHIYYIVNNKKNKYSVLKRILDINPDIYGIIFCKTKKETKKIANFLIQDGYNADAINGDLSQSQREFVMNRFRKKCLQFLVATDVASRGIDINDITHVIHYNIPNESEIYVHRSGRTGRAGNTGISVCIIHSKETHYMKEFERKIGKNFERIMVPTGKEICEKQLLHFVEKIKKVSVEKTSIMDKFLPTIQKKLESINKEELIKRFSWIEMNRFFYRKNSHQDLNEDHFLYKERKKKLRSRKKKKEFFSKLFLNIGYKDNLTKLGLIHLINKATNNSRINIGHIEILSNFSLFEVEKRYQNKILTGMNRINNHSYGRPLSIEIKN